MCPAIVPVISGVGRRTNMQAFVLDILARHVIATSRGNEKLLAAMHCNTIVSTKREPRCVDILYLPGCQN